MTCDGANPYNPAGKPEDAPRMRRFAKRFIVLLPLLAACSTTSPDVIQRSDAQRMSQVQDATVLTVRPVVVEGSQSGVGGVSGAVVGGVAGSSVGGSREAVAVGVMVGVTVPVSVGVAVADGTGVSVLVGVMVAVKVGMAMVAGRPTTRATRNCSTMPSRLAVRCSTGNHWLRTGTISG